MKRKLKRPGVDNIFIQKELPEREKFDNQLRESEQRYRIIFEKTPTPILIIDTEGNYIDFNEAACKFFECSHDELLNKNIRNFIMPISDKQIYKEHTYLPAEAGTVETEYYINNQIKVLELSAIPALWRSKRVFFCMGKETTKRKEAEKKFNESYELLERVFSNTHFLIAYLDTHFNFIHVNKTYAESYGHTPDFYLGKNYFDLFPDDEQKSIFKRVVKTNKAYSAFAQNPGQTNKYWDWTLQPIKSTSDKVEGLILCLLDVTEKKQAEQELIKTQKELIEAQRLSDIGTLAATVAHELRNPLGVILTAAYNIKRKRQNPSLDKHIANIEKKVAESEQIINNLLSYSRIKPPHYEKIQLSNILNECIHSAQKKFYKHKVHIDKNFNLFKKTFIDADPVQLSEIFNNILNNAYQAFPDKTGRIEIKIASDKNNFITIHFIDNGIGIDKDDLEKVFEPFYTLKSKGTGLGLTICDELTGLHNGEIKIKSKKGQGTTVSVCLPLERTLKK